ncbi:MAG: CDC48 family AAA ATPase [Candidatus Woesearchaeota archaeon]|jgi:transitional endoplasmic reticulum ATPase
MAIKIIKLKVAEAIQDDVNKGIVRVDSSFMHDLGIRSGDIVEIKGERVCYAIADRAFPGDIGLNIIRMDGITRRNAKTGIGESVEVKKGAVKEAKRVIIAPAQKGIVVRASPALFKQGLLGRVVMKGDIVSLGGTTRRRNMMSSSPFFNNDIFSAFEEGLPGFGFGDIKFVVVDTDPKQVVIISDMTEVRFNAEAVEFDEEKILDVTYEDVGGLTDEIKKVREMVELPLKHPEIFERLGIEPPKGVLLHGPPGTGKTLLAKAVANETNSHFILINGPEIMSKFYGQSEQNLRKKFEDAEKNAPSIIFIDEIDAIATKREDSHGEVERRVVAQLLALMDGLKSRGKVVVIAATNIPDAIDSALRRPGRFDREIELGVPGKEARLNILKIHTRNMPLTKDFDLKRIADITHGFVGADLASLTKESAMVVLRRLLPELKLKEDEPIPKEFLEKLKISQDDFMEALKTVRPSAMREVLVEIPNITWDDVGGLVEVKQELKEAVEWPLKFPESFSTLGVKPPQGILLYGPPGTGKTLMAKAVAKQCEANFILVKGPELLSKWVGESEKAVRKVFKRARQTSPTIIFFDEIDSLAPKRGMSSDSNVTERVVNQLLTEMDGLEDLTNVVVIAATNRPDILDTALLRPGRFDRIILVPVPDIDARKAIFAVHTKPMPLASDVDIDYLAEQTEGYVGADIESVCREAAIFVLREDIKAKKVTKQAFEKALGKVKQSVTKEIEEMYKQMQDYFKQAHAKQMEKDKPLYYG